MSRTNASGLVLMDGATSVRGLRGWWGLVRRWPALRRQLVTSDGYVAHRIYLAGPTTVGLLTWWEDRRAVYAFAHGPGHHEIWDWAVRHNTTKGGWLASYELTAGGALWGTGTPLANRFGRYVEEPTAPAPRGCPAHHT